jgi:hypothetical protein
MGLPVRQRRVLERIEITLNGSDPKLAALYGIFARLNRDEEMPRIEQLRHGAQAALARLRMIAAAICSRLHLRWPFRLQPHQRVALYFPIAVAVAITAIVFIARATPGNTCAQPRAQSTAHDKTKLCRSPYSLSPLYLGNK